MNETELILSHKGLDDIQVPLSIEEGNPAEVTVWKGLVKALEGNIEINEWLYLAAKMGCTLVFMLEEADRKDHHSRHSSGDLYPYSIYFFLLEK